MPETESWVSRGTSPAPAVEAGDCLGPISERRRYPLGAVNGAPEASVNAARPAAGNAQAYSRGADHASQLGVAHFRGCDAQNGALQPCV